MTKEMSNSFSKKTLQDYEVISVLGSGSFGTCYKVRDKETDKIYAWKAVDYDELDDIRLASLVSEIRVLRQFQHPNIVQYYHHLNSNEAKSIFIIMEWCEGGDLSSLITQARKTRKRFDEKYIWRVLFQICKALQVCHSKLEHGTVLHRDIKPANIFLDAYGNAKLGDFGLARMLRRNQNFAESFVGTPYYMSPELIEGSKYDCRSDVWAMGCLTYEMAALKPPFRGNKLQQLSTNISNGKYTEISNLYSKDLQEIIRFMLEVSDKKRPSVEMLARHPSVVRNIAQLDCKFEPLVEAEKTFLFTEDNTPRTRLRYSHSTSSNDNSYYEDAQRWGVSGVFTPDLRTDIFYSVNRKLYPRAFQQSDSELYKSTRRHGEHINKNAETQPVKSIKSPNALTENIFNEFLQERLHAIRAHEALLKQKEESLAALELKLNEKERRLQDIQIKLDKRHLCLEHKLRSLKPKKHSKSLAEIPNSTKIFPKANFKRFPAERVTHPKQLKNNDETYCSIEPQDALTPTVAKLDLATLPAAKKFSTIRKVTFQSPKRIVSYDIENMPPEPRSAMALKPTNKFRTSICSSSDGSNSDGTTQRRKSLLSILGIKRGNKESTKGRTSIEVTQQANTIHQKPRGEQILSKCEPEKLTNFWTKENKRAAFDLLAAMNTVDSSKRLSNCEGRQSMREPHRLSLRRDRMRQSMKVLPLAMEMA